MTDINDTIREREARYGSLEFVAGTSQALKHICSNRVRPHKFCSLHNEAIDMICHKLARILCGDPNYADSWHDLGGFAVRTAQILDERNKEANNGNRNESEEKSH